MSFGRVVASAAAMAAVAGCAVVALGMSRPDNVPDASHRAYESSAAAAPDTALPPASLYLPAHVVAAASSPAPVGSTASQTRTPAATRPAPSNTSPRSTRAAAPVPATTPQPAARATTHTPAPARSTTVAAAPRPVAKPALVRGVALPLRYSTGTATRVITVTAGHTWNTVATLQAWNKAPGGGWLRYGSPVTAHIGAQGMTTAPSESKSATPMGSFTLTQAFGALADPGTPLPYFRTDGADWWISQSGPLYNTHQRCWSSCSFRLGDPNEHLHYETPYYDYAVVIDYNTRNAPGGVRQGAGSAFFLHVTDGSPTAGCVAIPQTTLVNLMRWLNPSTHPRILIGTA